MIAYVVAGDPDLDTSGRVIAALARSGVDLIELGIPYGDPLADGPTVAAAGQRALEAGTSIDDAIELAGRAQPVPVIMFTYMNPVVQYGLERFARRLAERGVLGAIVPDVPIEETAEVRAAFAPHGLELPLLVAPTTPPARARTIAAQSQGFVYLVSRLGVTGAGASPDFGAIRRQLRALRAVSDRPIAVGFGISTPHHVRAVAGEADGVIIGSALIDAFAGVRGEEAGRRAADFARSLAAGTAASPPLRDRPPEREAPLGVVGDVPTDRER